jgi:hypothetical protein
VHRRDQLRHLCHLHAPGDDPPRQAAERKRANREVDASCDRQRREDGQRHSRDAEAIAAASRQWMGETLEGENEEHARREIGQGNLVR